jgi:hypothetical protein
MPLTPIEAQVAAESLGIAGVRLRQALDALALHDSSDHRRSAAEKQSIRDKLVAAAGEAFWRYVVQRELLGVRDPEYVAQEYAVPAEVWQSMGPIRETSQ